MLASTLLQRQEEKAGSCSAKCGHDEADWKNQKLYFFDWLLLRSDCYFFEDVRFCDLQGEELGHLQVAITVFLPFRQASGARSLMFCLYAHFIHIFCTHATLHFFS